MAFLLPLLGSVAGAATSSLLGGASGGPPAQPGVASRGSSDFAPVTNVNAVGAVDLKGIGDLINSINAENNDTASNFGYLSAVPGTGIKAGGLLPIVALIGGVLVLALFLKKHK